MPGAGPLLPAEARPHAGSHRRRAPRAPPPPWWWRWWFCRQGRRQETTRMLRPPPAAAAGDGRPAGAVRVRGTFRSRSPSGFDRLLLRRERPPGAGRTLGPSRPLGRNSDPERSWPLKRIPTPRRLGLSHGRRGGRRRLRSAPVRRRSAPDRSRPETGPRSGSVGRVASRSIEKIRMK